MPVGRIGWERSGGVGEVYSWTVVHRPVTAEFETSLRASDCHAGRGLSDADQHHRRRRPTSWQSACPCRSSSCEVECRTSPCRTSPPAVSPLRTSGDLPMTAYLVLGVLATNDEQLTAGEIKTRAELSVGHFYWSPSVSHVRRELNDCWRGTWSARSKPNPASAPSPCTRRRMPGCDALRRWVADTCPASDQVVIKHPVILKTWLARGDGSRARRRHPRPAPGGHPCAARRGAVEPAATREVGISDDPSQRFSFAVLDYSIRGLYAELSNIAQLRDEISLGTAEDPIRRVHRRKGQLRERSTTPVGSESHGRTNRGVRRTIHSTCPGRNTACASAAWPSIGRSVSCAALSRRCRAGGWGNTRVSGIGYAAMGTAAGLVSWSDDRHRRCRKHFDRTGHRHVGNCRGTACAAGGRRCDACQLDRADLRRFDVLQPRLDDLRSAAGHPVPAAGRRASPTPSIATAAAAARTSWCWPRGGVPVRQEPRWASCRPRTIRRWTTSSW